MIVAANQPYFAPFAGFFIKASLADTFVILDTVQFPRGGTWITRNRFKNDQGTLWLSIPVWKKGLGDQKIDEVRICREGGWQRKHLESFRYAYTHAPFFAGHLEFIENTFSYVPERILDLNMTIIRYLFDELGIDTEIVLLSELKIEGHGDPLLIEVCLALKADAFLAQAPAGKYLEERLFLKEGIELKFFKVAPIIYPQLWGDFIPNLSAFDLILNCGPKARDLLVAR